MSIDELIKQFREAGLPGKVAEPMEGMLAATAALRQLYPPEHLYRLDFGAQAIALLIDYVRSRPGASELLVSYIGHEQGPADFYRGLGFVETGEVDDGEVVMRLDLTN